MTRLILAVPRLKRLCSASVGKSNCSSNGSNLRIKHFFGTSSNSVKTQIWIAVAVYVLIAIIKKQLRLPHSLYTILQILSTTLFEKTPVLLVFQRYEEETRPDDPSKQLMLFDI